MKRNDRIAEAMVTGLLFGLILFCSVVWFLAYKFLSIDLIKKAHSKDWTPEQLAVITRAETVMIVGSVAAALLAVAVWKVSGMIKRSGEMKNEQ